MAQRDMNQHPRPSNRDGDTEGVIVIRFCLAEFCSHEFYHGWWLYERETNDGQPNRFDWGWMHDTSSWSDQKELNDLCRREGYDPPPVERYAQTFAQWFAATFPNGLRVRVHRRTGGKGRYELIETVRWRPRQARGVIRTIRGAAMATMYRRNSRRRHRSN